jgi:hypothetical protein
MIGANDVDGDDFLETADRHRLAGGKGECPSRLRRFCVRDRSAMALVPETSGYIEAFGAAGWFL